METDTPLALNDHKRALGGAETETAKKVKVEPVATNKDIVVSTTTTTEARALDPLMTRRLTREIGDLMKGNSRGEMGIEFELLNSDSLSEWRALWYYDMAETDGATETQNALAKQLKARGLDYIEFRIVFPDAYPAEAPFIYNYYPRLKGNYIFSNGGLCAQTLSSEFGWSCASKASSLMLTVRSLLENAGCRLQSIEAGDCGGSKKRLETPFDEAGARKDFNAISRLHSKGWHGSAGRS